MPPRIPTAEDFAPLSRTHPHILHFPQPPEGTIAIMLLLHGLGDSHMPFASFARAVNLPGVLAISICAPSPLPLGDFTAAEDAGAGSGSSTGAPGGNSGGSGKAGGSAGPGAGGRPCGFHWGDDILVDPRSAGLDSDPGFEKSKRVILDKFVGEVLIGKCGWEYSDILLFGFGQGGSLALGLASSLRTLPRVRDVSEEKGEASGKDKGDGKRLDEEGDNYAIDPLTGEPPSSSTSKTPSSSSSTSTRPSSDRFKGIVSIGGPLPQSMIPTISSRNKSRTKVCLVQMNGSNTQRVKEEFESVQSVNWKRRDVAMPRDREEMFPIMKFLADRLNEGAIR